MASISTDEGAPTAAALSIDMRQVGLPFFYNFLFGFMVNLHVTSHHILLAIILFNVPMCFKALLLVLFRMFILCNGKGLSCRMDTSVM